MFASRLKVYGVEILVESFDSKVKSDLDHDFSYFLTEKLEKAQPECFSLRVLPAEKRPRFWIPLFKTKRSTLFLSPKGVRRVCFFEAAWLEYAVTDKKCAIFSSDPIKAYEAVYFVLLSYLGEALSLSGMHRIHGMGFKFKGQGAVLLAPSGGGKSTLAMELLKREDFCILSDDTPVLNEQGRMLAFPQRIALNEKPVVEDRFLRRFKRHNHSEKYVVGADYFGGKIAGDSEIQWLFLLDSQNSKSGLKEVSRLRSLWPIMKWLVIGYETPQIWELFLRSGSGILKSHTRILLGRLKTAAVLLAKSRVAVVHRGETVEDTGNRISEFLHNQTRHYDPKR